MAAPKGAKGLALLLGMPKKGEEESEEDMDVGADRETTAGTAFADAVKSGDGAAIASAFRELQEACSSASYGDEEEEG